MILSCCAWALSGPEEQNLDQLATSSATSMPPGLRCPARQCLADLGLRVPCVAIAFPEAPLDSADDQEAARAFSQLAAGLHHAHELGAATAYVVPGMDRSPAALERYARAIEHLAEQAVGLGLRLGIEHFPGRCLPTGAATLEFIEDIAIPTSTCFTTWATPRSG